MDENYFDGKRSITRFRLSQTINIKNKTRQIGVCLSLQNSFYAKKHREALLSAQEISDVHLINISEDQAKEIRDLCGEQLQIAGLTEKDKLASERKILESLVEKFVNWINAKSEFLHCIKESNRTFLISFGFVKSS
jgi:hypothetical protein